MAGVPAAVNALSHFLHAAAPPPARSAATQPLHGSAGSDPGWNLPAGHSSHCRLPHTDLYLPGGHCGQPPPALLYLPATPLHSPFFVGTGVGTAVYSGVSAGGGGRSGAMHSEAAAALCVG
jgi:hypothetical protein